MELPRPILERSAIETLIAESLPTSPTHATARCRWCGSEFVKVHVRMPEETDPAPQIAGHWLCRTVACAERQLRWAIEDKRESTRVDGTSPWIYVPSPVGAELHEATEANVCLGGEVGGCKSYSLRWNSIYWALKVPGLRVLLLRNSLKELESTHLLDIELTEQKLIAGASYVKGEKTLYFRNGSFVRAGHCYKPEDYKAYLSQQFDDIDIDEASQMHRTKITNLASRARSTNPMLLAMRGGARVRLTTNPGGIGAIYIEEHYIDKVVDRRLHTDYDPADYRYIAAGTNDNPYVEEGYRKKRLNPLDPDRFAELADGKWGRAGSRFFANFDQATHVTGGA